MGGGGVASCLFIDMNNTIAIARFMALHVYIRMDTQCHVNYYYAGVCVCVCTQLTLPTT